MEGLLKVEPTLGEMKEKVNKIRNSEAFEKAVLNIEISNYPEDRNYNK